MSNNRSFSVINWNPIPRVELDAVRRVERDVCLDLWCFLKVRWLLVCWLPASACRFLSAKWFLWLPVKSTSPTKWTLSAGPSFSSPFWPSFWRQLLLSGVSCLREHIETVRTGHFQLLMNVSNKTAAVTKIRFCFRVGLNRVGFCVSTEIGFVDGVHHSFAHAERCFRWKLDGEERIYPGLTLKENTDGIKDDFELAMSRTSLFWNLSTTGTTTDLNFSLFHPIFSAK